MLNVYTKFHKIEKQQHEIMLNTFSWSLIIWEPAIETWAQEVNWGLASWTVLSPWKHIYFNPCIQAWSPKLHKVKMLLEKVQRRATSMVRGLKNLPYETRLKKLCICSQERWRLRGEKNMSIAANSSNWQMSPEDTRWNYLNQDVIQQSDRTSVCRLSVVERARSYTGRHECTVN